MEKKAYIISVVGPKGGVGKTTISSNLAIALAGNGKKVVVIDLDLGASNLHTFFGLKNSSFSLDDFIYNRVNSLDKIICDTEIPNMGIICGGDIPGIANLHYSKKQKLIRHLSMLDCDVVILDLGAGSSNNVIDFMIFSHLGLLVTTPELPSLLNTYSFIKTMIFRRLALYFRKVENDALLELLEKAKDVKTNPSLKTMEGIITQSCKIDPSAPESINTILNKFKPIIIVNRVRSKKDENAGYVIRDLMKQYLQVTSSNVIITREDDAVGFAIARMKPVVIDNPACDFSQDIKKISNIICQA